MYDKSRNVEGETRGKWRFSEMCVAKWIFQLHVNTVFLLIEKTDPRK